MLTRIPSPAFVERSISAINKCVIFRHVCAKWTSGLYENAHCVLALIVVRSCLFLRRFDVLLLQSETGNDSPGNTSVLSMLHLLPTLVFSMYFDYRFKKLKFCNVQQKLMTLFNAYFNLCQWRNSLVSKLK